VWVGLGTADKPDTPHVAHPAEYADTNLSRELLLNPRGLPLPRVKLVAYQLAQALEHIHSQQVGRRL
jgi:serine/threonine protein kinase